MHPNSSPSPDHQFAKQPPVIIGIFKDLNQHFHIAKKLAYGETHMHSMFIKGHLEAHFENIDDLKTKLSGIMTIQPTNSKPSVTFADKAPPRLSDSQALKTLRTNIQQLSGKVKMALNRTNKPFGKATTLWLKELQRKLSNDLSRTSYFLQ